MRLKEPDGRGDGHSNGVHRLQDHDHAAAGDGDPSPMEHEEAEERAALLRFARSQPTSYRELQAVFRARADLPSEPARPRLEGVLTLPVSKTHREPCTTCTGCWQLCLVAVHRTYLGHPDFTLRYRGRCAALHLLPR